MKYSPEEKPVLNEKIQTRIPDRFIPESKFSGYLTNSRKNPHVPDELPLNKTEKPDKKIKEGIRLFRMKRWEQARQEFLLVDASGYSNEQQAELAYYLGLCCTKLGRFDDALLYLEQVITIGADLLRIYQCRMTLAYIYVTTGRAKMAEFELKRLRNAGFESAPLYNTLAYASYVQKRYRNAVELYERALDLDKDNATALNSMGYILADTGMDLMRGLRLCRKAVDIKPQNAAYLDSLGWAYFKCGEFTEARGLLRRAAELAPKEKEIKEHIRIVTGGAR